MVRAVFPGHIFEQVVSDNRPDGGVLSLIMKQISKWKSLRERVADLEDGESIVLKCEGNPREEARKIRIGLRGAKACILIRRKVRVVEGKIVITRLGTWRTLSFIARDPSSSPFNEPRLPNLS
jgi:hypothetical protein